MEILVFKRKTKGISYKLSRIVNLWLIDMLIG